ncbi:hypothetical protein KVP09_13990 [Alcaligenaceae bacterium CGII-47]|nr:hypothetical protein [Alcaligenaceae bacterium CGII-47]
MLAFACGIGIWGAILLAPPPTITPATLAIKHTDNVDLEPLVRWFGGGSARLRLQIIGLIAAGPQGVALLAINGAPPQAYRVGQTLAPGVMLGAVHAGAISIEQDGLIEDITTPPQALPANGFVPVHPRDIPR